MADPKPVEDIIQDMRPLIVNYELRALLIALARCFEVEMAVSHNLAEKHRHEHNAQVEFKNVRKAYIDWLTVALREEEKT